MSKLRIESLVRPHSNQDMEVSEPPGNNTAQAQQMTDPIEDFPTADRPISDIVLKEMLISLRSSLQSDMVKGINQCHKEVQAIGVILDRVEQQMEEYSSTYNTMVDTHAAQGEDISWLKDKVAELEDRSRMNNIKLRGVPESVPATHLLQYAHALFSTLGSALTTQDLIVDRIHKIPKPSSLPEGTQRDVLLRVHFYHVKEQILQAARRPNNILPQYTDIQQLPDLSRHTLQRRRNLATITKALRNHKISHKWKYPATLSITHNGTTKTITTMEDGIGVLR